jgi:Uma2 family endonuclease
MSDAAAAPAVEYPDSDGKPMADNTLQFEWVTALKYGFEDYFKDRPDVFVAGDLLWYPLEGNNKRRQGPDVLIAFGRPKGFRGSYRQWEEGGVPPQVVFEVLSPGNRSGELARKLLFYERYGVEEYYVYDPYTGHLTVQVREAERFTAVPNPDGFRSPRMGVTFDLTGSTLVVRRPDGQKFLTYAEQAARAERMAARLRELGIDPDTV